MATGYHLSMNPDDDVCVCFHVPLRKIRGYLARENPSSASLLSECLGAGTGCGWCVPTLRALHREHQVARDEIDAGACDAVECDGEREAVDLTISREAYAEARKQYRAQKSRGTTQQP